MKRDKMSALTLLRFGFHADHEDSREIARCSQIFNFFMKHLRLQWNI